MVAAVRPVHAIAVAQLRLRQAISRIPCNLRCGADSIWLGLSLAAGCHVLQNVLFLMAAALGPWQQQARLFPGLRSPWPHRGSLPGRPSVHNAGLTRRPAVAHHGPLPV